MNVPRAAPIATRDGGHRRARKIQVSMTTFASGLNAQRVPLWRTHGVTGGREPHGWVFRQPRIAPPAFRRASRHAKVKRPTIVALPSYVSILVHQATSIGGLFLAPQIFSSASDLSAQICAALCGHRCIRVTTPTWQGASAQSSYITNRGRLGFGHRELAFRRFETGLRALGKLTNVFLDGIS